MMNLKIALGLLLASMAALQADPVAWWRFEGSYDSEVNANHFVLSPGKESGFSDDVPAASLLDDTKKEYSNAQSFGMDSGSGAVCEKSSLIDEVMETSSFTIEAFIKLDKSTFPTEEIPTFQRIIGNSVNEEPGGWGLMVHEGRLRFFAFQGLDGKVKEGRHETDLNDGNWHHVAAVGARDGEFLTVQLYVDGQPNPNIIDVQGESPTGNAIIPLNRPYLVGSYNRFYGKIDEIRISNNALSEGQFLTINGSTH